MLRKHSFTAAFIIIKIKCEMSENHILVELMVLLLVYLDILILLDINCQQ